MEEGSSSQLVILLRVYIVTGHSGIHERPNRQDHEQQGEAMRQDRVIRKRGQVLTVERAVHFCIEGFYADRIIPVDGAVLACNGVEVSGIIHTSMRHECNRLIEDQVPFPPSVGTRIVVGGLHLRWQTVERWGMMRLELGYLQASGFAKPPSGRLAPHLQAVRSKNRSAYSAQSHGLSVQLT